MTSNIRLYPDTPENCHTLHLPEPYSNEEIYFWNKFSDYLPYHRHRDLEKVVRYYHSNPDTIPLDYYHSKNGQELLSKMDENPSYIHVISDLEHIFPGGRPEQHFLMTLLLTHLNDWNLQFNKDSIIWTPTADSLRHSSICSQLALVANFMLEPTIHVIYPHIKPNQKKNLQGRLATYYREGKINQIMETFVDLGTVRTTTASVFNATNPTTIYQCNYRENAGKNQIAPLGEQQEFFMKTLLYIKLDRQMPTGTKLNKRNKI